MKLRGGTLLALGAIVSACAVHIGDAPPPSPGAAHPSPAPAPAPAPAPMPGPVARPAAPPTPAAPTPPPPQPVAATPPPPVAAPPSPGAIHHAGPMGATTPSAPVGGTPATLASATTPLGSPRPVRHLGASVYQAMDPVNVKFVQSARARTPKACGPTEVAPGVWVRIDCHNYQPIATAKPHWTAHKARTVGKLRQKRVMRPSALTGGGGGGGEKGGVPKGGGGGERADGPSLDGDFPETVDHRTSNGEGPIKNQGMVGACTAFSLSSAMDNAILRAGKSDVTSPTHLWSHYATPHMSTAGEQNVGRSITSFDVWPYSAKEACELSTEPDDDCGGSYDVKPGSAKSDARLQALLAKAESSGVQKLVGIEKLAVAPPDINEIKSVLSSGADLWIAMKIGPSWMSSSGIVSNGNVIKDWTTSEGGHAILMSGYRKGTNGSNQFLIHNSWGESWGDHGYAWVSEAMVNKWMTYAYKVKIEDGVKPTPTAQLTDDDCAADELIDAVTLACGKMCSDDSRPSGGQCGSGDATGGGFKKH